MASLYESYLSNLTLQGWGCNNWSTAEQFCRGEL